MNVSIRSSSILNDLNERLKRIVGGLLELKEEEKDEKEEEDSESLSINSSNSSKKNKRKKSKRKKKKKKEKFSSHNHQSSPSHIWKFRPNKDEVNLVYGKRDISI